jgi:arsenate reductase-like glutaredoxin family protein
LLDRGAELDLVDLNKGLSVTQLDELIGSRDYRLFLNSRNELYRERGMKDNPPSRDEALRLMAAHPNLIKRPVVVKGKKIVLGFDEAELEEILK